LHAALVRSPVPHAKIKAIDLSAAEAMAGVEAILTAETLSELGVADMPVTWRQPEQKGATYPLLAKDVVRFVGEGVAIVAATSRYLAEDAAAAVDVSYEDLPVNVDPMRSLDADTPVIHPEWGDNEIVRVQREVGDVEATFEAAPVVLSERLRSHRYAACPLETRAAVAAATPATGEVTVWMANQAPHRAKTHIARQLGLDENSIRVIAPHVGGAFGLKDHAYAEEVMTVVLARATGRPVKWIEDRAEHFLASAHAREQVHDVAIAADEDGRILGVKDRFVADYGAYCINIGVGPATTTQAILPGPYRFKGYLTDLSAVATNKVPSGAYRGFGQPQATFVMERMIDRLARHLGLDPADVRRRNLVQPDEMPYESPAGLVYDSGDYPAALDAALEQVGYDEWRARQREGRENGRHLGIGIASYVEISGMAPSSDMAFVGFDIGGYAHAVVDIGPAGNVTIATGIAGSGQGHQTTLAQICATELGVSVEDVRVIQGDTVSTPYDAAGSIGSRTAVVGGVAVMRASRQIRGKLLDLAAHMLEASPADLVIEDGRVAVKGAASRGVSIQEVAEQATLAHSLPEGMEPRLHAHEINDPEDLTFAYGVHVAVVDVDPPTGVIDPLEYVVVHDCGTVINPSVVEGQILGGVAQGIGGALLEELVYSDEGQLMTTSFMDYMLPTAGEVPAIGLGHSEVPAPNVDGGMKGTGEGGAIGPPAAFANAVEDALSPMGATVNETPLAPDYVWSLANGNRT
ncbi:MAG: xanthine dehydrogenase family protein molybdopterin-binding subunit, partial [Thermoleophilia bacterium]|nr:xanthine dehydrogenase family protein molybdopterin-binding subunit [Thermoleophilia bacterium]